MNKSLEKDTAATLLWLKYSFEACDLRGSAAYYSRLRHPWRGWSAAYPETTGYLIETLLDYHALTGEAWLLEYAQKGADWILSLQHENGALPGGVGERGAASVFNTGMMLFGLVASPQPPKGERLEGAKKAVDWLVSILEEDGSWQQGAYKSGFTPSYYTRVIWAVLKVNQHLQSDDIEQVMRKALQYYKAKVTPQHSVEDWAFAKNQPAFTHTIAYTMRGFLECGALLQDKESLDIAQNMAFRLIEDFDKHQQLAGTYDENWRGDYSFVCITGNAQLSLNCSRLFQLTDNELFKAYAKIFFDTVRDAPSRIPMKGYRGGIAGSQPLWGSYQPMQYPNWAAKFWLDARRMLEEL
jgi:hypothetical protein